MRKTWLTLLILVLTVALVAGCGGPAQQSQQGSSSDNTSSNTSTPTKDSIVIALQGEPTTLDPQYPDDGNMRAVTDNVFERLMELDGKTLQPKPGLATDIKEVDPTTWQLTLREGVKFHNGDPFTAEDAVFSIKRIIDPAYKSQIAGNFSTIKDAKVVDAKTIQIITDGPDPILPKRLTKLDIVNKKYVEANPDKVATAPVGTGPYQVESWNRGVDIKIKAFDGYWGNKPAIKAATYRFIQEGSTRLSALKAGEIDLAVNMLPEYVDQLPAYKTSDGIEFTFLRFNTLRGPMKNKLIRQAACYAIDRDTLAKSLFMGYANVAQGQMAKPGYFGFNDSLKPYPYDPEKAKQLLKEAGYNGEVIQLVSERGRWLKDGELSEAVASMLTDAGFNVKLTFLSWQEWLDTLFNVEKAPDIMFSSNGNELFDMDRFYQAIIKTGGPQSTYSNPEIDKKITEARNEMDTQKRLQLYKELSQAVYDDPFGIPLLNLKDIYGMSKNLDWEPRQDSRITVYEMKLK